jgi:hypothetical protein
MIRRPIATAIWLTTLVFVITGVLVQVLAWRGVFYPYWIATVGLGVVYSTLGYLIVRRRPENRVGWVFVAFGLAGSVTLLLGETAVALAVSAPSGALMLASECVRLAGVLSLGFLVLLYPTGSLPSRRWSWVAWALGVAMVGLILQTIASPGPVLGTEWSDQLILDIENPLRAAWPASLVRVLEALSPLGIIGLVGAVASIVARYRASRTTERQQIKLFVFAAVTSFIVLMGATIALPEPMEGLLGEVLWDSLVVVPPGVATAAILRHGLFDIDRIISRTLSYALVTALLAGAYLALVLLFQRVTSVFIDASDLAVAASTLVVAAAFVPLRRRVQRAVDRRFNRARYDAAEAIGLFTARLRDEVDIDTLSSDLQTLVHHTMEPAHLSLWLPDALDG